MATFYVKIKTDNDAFQLGLEYELLACLRRVIQSINAGDDISCPRKILDTNGNTVGSFGMKD